MSESSADEPTVGRLVAVNVGLPRDVSWHGRTVHTGVWKYPVEGPQRVRTLNIEGDGQGDLAGHGGPNRAVMVYQLASYTHWRQELGRDDLTHGQFGENFTVDGWPMTRSASATNTGSAPPSSRSANRASPATGWGYGWRNRDCPRCW